jgi:DegV family protein with EDD domain
MTVRIAIVTDSTAYLPPGLAEQHRITIVPLEVVIGGTAGRDGIDATPADVATALRERRTSVTTSRPSPADFVAAYRAAIDAGADAVLSIHLSAELSGTYDAASLAAEEMDRPVTVIDARSTAMGLGFAVLAAAEAVELGAGLKDAAAAAAATIARTTTLFYVDTLEHLRRGGRIGAAAALLGTALAVKPILFVLDGAVVVKEKVRTSSRALARLEELAIEAAEGGGCDLAIHHLAAPERADDLRVRLLERLPKVGRVVFSEVGAVVGAHTGPGVLAVVIVRRP